MHNIIIIILELSQITNFLSLCSLINLIILENMI